MTADASGHSPAWSAHLPAGADPSVLDLLAAESLPAAWVSQWRRSPRSAVVVDPGGVTLTAEEMEERSRTVAARFAAAGLAPGDRLILSAEPSIDLLVSYVAAHRYGLIIVPMNTAYGSAEVGHVVRNTTPAASVVDDAHRASAIRDSSSGPCLLLGPDVDLPGGVETALDASTRDTPALICHTSGTTGARKGAVLTSGNLLASAEALRIAWRWTESDRLALTLLLFHLHGLGVGLNGTFVSGASLILAGPFRPDTLAEAIAQYRATLFFGVPTMYYRLASSPYVGALQPLRLCVSGSAPLSAQLHEQVRSSCGQTILERYGMTETVMNVSNPYEGERKPGAVGLPLPGVEVRLDTQDQDRAVGEIQLRGPNVFGGYWNNPGATEATFTSDGWFRTGDIGCFDSDGYLSIVGRSKELIISGGYNVYPREVEDSLRDHPGVADVAVIGVPSEEWGETVTAVVVASGAVDEEDLLRFAAGRLATYKRPRKVLFADAIPRNELGKLLRIQLAGQSSL